MPSVLVLGGGGCSPPASGFVGSDDDTGSLDVSGVLVLMSGSEELVSDPDGLSGPDVLSGSGVLVLASGSGPSGSGVLTTGALTTGSDVTKSIGSGELLLLPLSGVLLLSGVLPALIGGLGASGGSDGVTGSGLDGLETGALGLGDRSGGSFSFGVAVELPTVPGGGAATGARAVSLVSTASGARAVVFVAVVLSVAGASAVCARRLLVPHTCSIHVSVSL